MTVAAYIYVYILCSVRFCVRVDVRYHPPLPRRDYTTTPTGPELWNLGSQLSLSLNCLYLGKLRFEARERGSLRG